MPKSSNKKISSVTAWPITCEDKWDHTKSIYLKVNVIARLDFELVYNDSEVHYATRTPSIYVYAIHISIKTINTIPLIIHPHTHLLEGLITFDD